MSMKKIYSINEVCTRLGISHVRLRVYIKQNLINPDYYYQTNKNKGRKFCCFKEDTVKKIERWHKRMCRMRRDRELNKFTPLK